MLVRGGGRDACSQDLPGSSALCTRARQTSQPEERTALVGQEGVHWGRPVLAHDFSGPRHHFVDSPWLFVPAARLPTPDGRHLRCPS